MKYVISYLIVPILFVISFSCKSNKTTEIEFVNDIENSTDTSIDALSPYEFFDEFHSDKFYCTKDNVCPVHIFIADDDSKVFGYFFINDKSNSTKLIPLFTDDQGRIYHEKNNYKINSIKQLDNNTISVNLNETKRKLFSKSKRNKEYIFTKKSFDNNFIQGRYLNEIFDNYNVIDDVKYGTAMGYWTNYSTGGNNDNYMDIVKTRATKLIKSQKKLDLLMDIYYPENDNIKKRPLIMMIHGGGFFIGDKKNDFMLDICPYLAKCGYTVASIDYRLGYIPTQAQIDRIGYQALQDARAAMRYLVAHANKYGIDTAHMYVGGTSAGAITGLNMTFMDDNFIPSSAESGFLRSSLGGLDDSGNKHKETFDIKAVINMWGAVHDSAMIAAHKDVAILSVHGDADMVVPFEYANPFLDAGKIAEWLTNKLCGSKVIHRQAQAHNYSREKLIVIPGAGHGPVFDDKDQLNENYYMIKDEMTTFLHDLNNKNLNDITLEDLNIHFIDDQLHINPNNDIISDYYINVVGGCITQNKKKNYRTTWFSNVRDKYYEFHITNKIGASKTLKLHVN